MQADKGEYARLIDRVAVLWTPTVLGAAAVLAIIGGGVTGLWNEYVLKVRAHESSTLCLVDT